MNAIRRIPPLPAAITGCEEAAARPASTTWGAWNWPDTSAETTTCGAPPIVST